MIDVSTLPVEVQQLIATAQIVNASAGPIVSGLDETAAADLRAAWADFEVALRPFGIAP